jgi:WD40 repeat protein
MQQRKREIRAYEPLKDILILSVGSHSSQTAHMSCLGPGTTVFDCAHVNALHGHSNSVCAVTFSPDGTRVVSRSFDKTLRVWDAGNVHIPTLSEAISKFQLGSGCCIPPGWYTCRVSSDKTLRVWDAGSGAHLNTLRGHSNLVCAVAFSPDGTLVVSGSYDTTLRPWDASSGVHINTLQGHS